MDKVVATGFTWSDVDRAHTKVCYYVARNLPEARNWIQFNRDWVTNLRILTPAEAAEYLARLED